MWCFYDWHIFTAFVLILNKQRHVSSAVNIQIYWLKVLNNHLISWVYGTESSQNSPAAAEDKVDTIMRRRRKAIKWKHKQCCSDCGFVVCGMAMAYWFLKSSNNYVQAFGYRWLRCKVRNNRGTAVSLTAVLLIFSSLITQWWCWNQD